MGWLPWDQAIAIAAVLAIAGIAARRASRRRLVEAGAFAREAATVLSLYAIWNYAERISLLKVDAALDRARRIWELERFLPLPRETFLQRVTLPHGWLVQASNLYYAVAHVPALVIFLLWLFARHRASYRRWRNVVALTTLACLLIQLVPVAPPRFLPELGFVDTGILYGQSVYGPLGQRAFDQLSAMPSVHVAWAVIVGAGVVDVSPSRHRWWVLLHPVLTALVVVVTANHWWLDGLVAVLLIGVAWLAVGAGAAILPSRSRRRIEPT